MDALWPELNYTDWKDTLATVQLFTQIVGKIRLKAMPWINHSWQVTLYVSSKGLTTGAMPYAKGIFEIEFDFNHHVLIITTSKGIEEHMQLQHLTVADFYKEIFDMLGNMNIDISIYATPNEIEHAIPFEKDDIHKTYSKEHIHNYWLALVQVEKVFTKFRAGFNGKCSPVHLFWGAFDLAVTRFSGRSAPLHLGGAPNMPVRIMQEAYSHEVSSAGFWPGNDAFPHAAFYSYCYPTPANFGEQVVEPAEAFYNKEMGEFFLLYDVVKTAANPEATLLKFLNSTYEAAANTGNWNRAELECDLTSFKNKNHYYIMKENVCTDIEEVEHIKTAKEHVCEECIKTGSHWMHLRTCQTCGVTLCCDSSPKKHMTKHFHATSHPVVISAEPGEKWMWCYKHEVMAEY